MGEGRIMLLGAPLGYPGDASQRLRTALAGADLVATGDTARLGRLAEDLGVSISGRVVAYSGAGEPRELIAAAREGGCVALVTGGGAATAADPGADPGHRLVAAAHRAGVPVTAVPGASVVATALAVSGLPCERFCCEGFLPEPAAARRERLAELAGEPRTLVFFEAPHRLPATLTQLGTAFGADRPAVLCQELAGAGEQVRRGGLAELAERVAADPPPGEVTLVVGGAGPAQRPALDQAALREAVAARRAAGLSHRDAVAEVAREHGLRRREVYQLTLPEAGAGGADS